MRASEINQLTISEVAALIRSGVVSPVAVTRATLDRIEQVDQHLNAYITVTPATALQAAEAAD